MHSQTQPNGWRFRGRRTSHFPRENVHKGRNVRGEAREREKKLFTAGVARRKKPSSYRQSRVRRDKNPAPRRNDSRTEKMENCGTMERRISRWISSSHCTFFTPFPLSTPFSIARCLTRRDRRGNSFSLCIRKWNIGRSFVRYLPRCTPLRFSFRFIYLSLCFTTDIYHRPHFLIRPIIRRRRRDRRPRHMLFDIRNRAPATSVFANSRHSPRRQNRSAI